MSLDVPTALLERAEQGAVSDAEFVECVRQSLPYAWSVVSEVAADLDRAPASAEFADHAIPPPSEADRGQLLRALASDAIRGGLERHFGMKLAFQNCHRVAALTWFRAVSHAVASRASAAARSARVRPRECLLPAVRREMPLSLSC